MIDRSMPLLELHRRQGGDAAVRPHGVALRELYKVTLDRGLQLRIAPDGKRTLLVRYTVKGSKTERQYRQLVAPGALDQQLHWWHQRKTLCSFCQPLVESRESGSTRTARHVQRVSEIETLVERVDCHQDRVAILKRDVFDAR